MVQSPSKKLIYCPVCKEETVHTPHPNDLVAIPDTEYVVCEKCNRHRAYYKI